MQVTSKSGKVYEMDWQRYGCSYAEPLLLVKKTYLKFFTFTHKVPLIRWSDGITYIEAADAKPDTLRKWFTAVINKYEDYYAAWQKELST